MSRMAFTRVVLLTLGPPVGTSARPASAYATKWLDFPP